MSVIKQIVKNTASGWASIIIKSLLTLITVPFLLGAVGSDGYGVIAVLGSLIALTSILDLGLRSALGQKLSEQVAMKNNLMFSQIISTAFVLYFAFAIIVSTAFYFLSPNMVDILNVKSTPNYDPVLLFQLYGVVGTFLSFITPIFSSSLQSHQRFDIVNLVHTVVSILTNVSVIGCIKFYDFEVLHWVLITIAFQVVGLVFLVVSFSTTCKGVGLSFSKVNISTIKPLFGTGGYMYLIQLSSTISNSSNPLIITSLHSVKSLSFYQPALSISSALTPLVMTLTSQLYPNVTKSHISGDQDTTNKIFLYGTKYTLILGSLVSACVFVFSDAFSKLWLHSSIGDDYLLVAGLIKLFVLVDVLTYSSGTQWSILLGMKKLKYLTKVLLTTAILDIGLSILFITYFGFGVASVLYSTIISKIIRVYLINKYTLNLLGIRLNTYLKTAVIRPALCFVLTALTAWGVVNNIECDSWVSLISGGSITGIAWLLYVWVLCLDANDKKMISAKQLANKR